ncbi:MAG: hypothetical protein ABMA25_10780, partial [Ilumatobacteraceae bacterium]
KDEADAARTEVGRRLLRTAETDKAVETAEGSSDSVWTTGSAVIELPSSTVAPEPTGVPGIDDAIPFCAAWAVYSGSVQSIGIANAFGGLSSLEIARLEVIAAASLVESVGGIGSNWPGELVGERSVVLTDLVGPFDRRAQKAVTALRDAGMTDDELTELTVIWMTALRERTAEDPVIAVPPLRDDLAAKVDAAAAAFDAAATPFGDDPSLIVESVETPLTDAYLSATCPDLASSGVGDAI